MFVPWLCFCGYFVYSISRIYIFSRTGFDPYMTMGSCMDVWYMDDQHRLEVCFSVGWITLEPTSSTMVDTSEFFARE